MKYPLKSTLMYSLIVVAILLPIGCGKTVDTELLSDKNVGQPIVVKTTNHFDSRQNSSAVSSALYAQALSGDIDTTRITGDVALYTISIDTMRNLDVLFEETPTQLLSYAYVSNLVSDISPVYIMNRTMREYVGGRSLRTPKQKAIMLLFEVIMNRDDAVPSTRMMARHELGDYYMYHDSRFPDRGKQWALQVLQDATLSQNANIHEKATYATIQLRLMRYYCYNDPEKGIAQIRRIENMNDNVIPFPEQPMQIMPIFEAAALVRLGRKSEAYKRIQDLYNKLDTIDDEIIHAELDKGVEAFFKQKGWSKD